MRDSETEAPPPAGLTPTTKRTLGQSMSLQGDAEKLATYYAAWAKDYDNDVGTDEYGVPNSVLLTLDAAAELIPRLGEKDLRILDAGCGTGRIGLALHGRGYTTIDGIDLSPEMVALAQERGIYRTLEAKIDLSIDPPSRWRHGAEVVVVGGVFTVGHIPPEALHCVAQLVEPGGVLIVSVRPGYFDTTNFGQVSEAFAGSDRAELLVHFDELPYTSDSHGLYYAYRIHYPDE